MSRADAGRQRSTGDIDAIEARILYEDNHLIAINKRVGEISQGDRTGDAAVGDLVAAYIKRRDGKPGNVFLTPVHRLDRPVSGVLLFAKTGKAAGRMSRLFRESAVEKRYWAVVATSPAAATGSLVHYLVRDRKVTKSFVVGEDRPGAKRAQLDYRVVARSDRYVLLEVTMSTGRHHQIRAQLAALGCPIRGDLKYGAPRSNPDGGISLHAALLRFDHPVGRGPVEIVAPFPEGTLWRVFAAATRLEEGERLV